MDSKHNVIIRPRDYLPERVPMYYGKNTPVGPDSFGRLMEFLGGLGAGPWPFFGFLYRRGHPQMRVRLGWVIALPEILTEFEDHWAMSPNLCKETLKSNVRWLQSHVKHENLSEALDEDWSGLSPLTRYIMAKYLSGMPEELVRKWEEAAEVQLLENPHYYDAAEFMNLGAYLPITDREEVFR